MTRRCGLCDHPEREAIDRALVAGGATRTIADRFSVHRSAVVRHAANHLPKLLTDAKQAGRVAQAGTLLAQVEELIEKAKAGVDRCELAKDDRTGVGWFRELRSTIELLGRVTKELSSDSTVTVTVGIWQRLGVKDEAEALEVIQDAREYQGMSEAVVAERMAAWVGRYLEAHPEERPRLAIMTG